MNKRLIVLMFSFFLIACSNRTVQNNFSENQLKSLNIFSQAIKENLSINNYDYLKDNSNKSIRNEKILKELVKIDFSKTNIFMSKIIYKEKTPFSILGINIGEDTFYFELMYNYDYHSKKWLIYKVNERRWDFLKKTKNKIKICISPYLENLAIIRAMVKVYLKEHNINETDTVQILSIVDELATNAIEHGYGYSDRGEIKIVLNIFEKTIFLTVEDSGKGYEINEDSKEDGGLGLFIVKKLVDVFKIQKKAKGTIFKIEKKLREAV